MTLFAACCYQDDLHDGIDWVRTSCVIAVSKSKDIFEPLIHQVRALHGELMLRTKHQACSSCSAVCTVERAAVLWCEAAGMNLDGAPERASASWR